MMPYGIIFYDYNILKNGYIQSNLKYSNIEYNRKHKMTFIKKIAIGIIKCLLYVLDEDHRINHIIDDDFKKFTDIKIINFDSDHNKASKVMRTVPYELWEVRTKDKKLIAADKHIVIKSDGTECYMENLKINDELKTDNGTQKVIGIKNLNIRTHTYDLELNDDHLYYSDGILSHNTTCAAAYLLWFTMFFPDKTVLICANKLSQALEIMDRIKYGYENLDKHQWLRPGIVEYNKGTVSFDNGSSIIARATTKDAGRGLSISCLRFDTSYVTVRNKTTGEIKNISIKELMESNTSTYDCSFGNPVLMRYNDTFEVLTIDGFKDYDGYAVSIKQTWLLTFEDKQIECTADHKFYSMDRDIWIESKDIIHNENIRTADGSVKFLYREEKDHTEVVDLVNVDDVHSFIANGLDVHNCLYLDEFGLIDSSF